LFYKNVRFICYLGCLDMHVNEVDPGCLEGLLHGAEELRVGGQHQVRHVARARVRGLVAVLFEDVLAS
jgi:hypothetical protein